MEKLPHQHQPMRNLMDVDGPEGGGRTPLTLQRSLAKKGISDYAAWLGYPPHITLVRVDDAEPRSLIPAAEGLLAQLSTIKIGLGGLGFFGGDQPVVWLVPVPNSSLLNAHTRLCSALEPLTVHGHYQPTSWIPHVTLAAGLDHGKAIAALSAVLPEFNPMVVTPSRLEVVSFPPAHVIWSAPVVA